MISGDERCIFSTGGSRACHDVSCHMFKLPQLVQAPPAWEGSLLSSRLPSTSPPPRSPKICSSQPVVNVAQVLFSSRPSARCLPRTLTLSAICSQISSRIPLDVPHFACYRSARMLCRETCQCLSSVRRSVGVKQPRLCSRRKFWRRGLEQWRTRRRPPRQERHVPHQPRALGRVIRSCRHRTGGTQREKGREADRQALTHRYYQHHDEKSSPRRARATRCYTASFRRSRW